MEPMDTAHYKEKLETELKLVQGELKTVGVQNPHNPADWEGKEVDMDVTNNEDDELGDKMEEYGENRAINDTLEVRYNNIERALGKIAGGTYGVCEIGGEKIEEDRLEANPAARTCKDHMEQESSLT